MYVAGGGGLLAGGWPVGSGGTGYFLSDEKSPMVKSCVRLGMNEVLQSAHAVLYMEGGKLTSCAMGQH